ncbi:hypothetical protein [Flavobacterium aquiphilum]|uniref:hypothetical protein n=1 Tax=Flavobacterium aquiphilum TaxID=3003261 RepID=UPI00247FBFEC|nr:hypothetical protein [Flavobacterium aquiphilum]
MKKIFYLLVFVSSLCTAQPNEIIAKPARNCYFVLDKTVIRFENNFISNKFILQYNRDHGIHNDLKHTEHYFNVLGENINLKILDLKEYKNLVMIGDIYVDTLNANKDLYRIENLEVQVLKNNKIVKKWTSVQQSISYSETNVLDGKKYFENGYIPYTDSLVNGDKLVILFRKKGKESFLKLHFEKKEGARKPFIIMSNSNDLNKTVSFENFIQESIDRLHKYSLDKSNFFESWPEDFAPTLIGNRNRHFKGEKYCLVFRKPNGKKRVYNSFEYRTSINSKLMNGQIRMESFFWI